MVSYKKFLLSLILLGSFFSYISYVVEVPYVFTSIFFWGTMLLFGVSHGFDDPKKLSINFSSAHGRKNLITYLFLMAVFCIVRYFLPIVAMFLFIIIAAIHFGDDHRDYINFQASKRWYISLSWGALVILSIIVFNANEVFNLIKPIIEFNIFSHSAWFWILACLFFFLCLGLLYLYLHSTIDKNLLIYEFIFLLVILVLAHTGGLLLSFGFYFGLGHGCKEIFLKDGGNTFKFNVYIDFMVNNIMTLCATALVGIVYFFTISFYFPSLSTEMSFFIFLSLLTFPHFIMRSGVYRYFKGI